MSAPVSRPAPSPAIDDLPRVLREIAEVCGLGVALTLAAEYGSSHGLYVPKTPRIEHPLCQLIGWEALQALCSLYPGETIEIPRAAGRNVKAVVLAMDDASSAEAARAAGCTTRYVRKLRAELRPDDRQQKLF